MAKKAQPKQTGPVFPDLTFTEPEEKTTASAGQDDSAKILADLQQQIGRLQSDLETQRQTNLALMSQPQVQAAPEAPKAVDMSGLPDPTLDPEAYAAEVAKRTTNYIGQVQQHQQAQASAGEVRNNRLNALWEDFADKYPELADQPDRVEFVATKLSQKAAQRGLDVNRYVFGASGKFIDDVAKEMEKTFGKATAKDEEEDDTEDTRTAGLIGGQEGGSRAAEPEGKGGFQPHSMFGDVQEWQRKTGFTR